MKTRPQHRESTSKFLQEILRTSKPDAILQFGSSINGDHWKHSDVDLFILTKKTKTHTAFYAERDGVVFHGNVISPRAFQEKINDPTKLTFHSLFESSRILYDQTTWIKKEKLRLSQYPKQNRIYHVVERLEAILYHIYRMKKSSAIHGNTNSAFDLPTSSLIKIFEIARIHDGVYFGKSVLGKLTQSEIKTFKHLENQSIDRQIALLENQVSPWLKKYLPLWIGLVRNQKPNLSLEVLSEILKVDAFHVYIEANQRRLISIDQRVRKNHGFAIKEWVICANL